MNNTRSAVMASLFLVAFLAFGSLPYAADGDSTPHRFGAVIDACGISIDEDDSGTDDVCDPVFTSRRPATWRIDMTSFEVVERRWQDPMPDGRWSPS